MGQNSDTENDNILEDDESRYSYHYYEQHLVHRIHHFYLSKSIGDPDGYIEMIHRIRMAGADEVIYIHLNTPGGSLSTGIQIINAIQNTQAHVICSVEAEAHSLGTLIFLAADEFIVHDNCIMLFHNVSSGTSGKGHEQLAHVMATSEWFTSIARKLYLPFLTEDELASIIKGEDLWIQTPSIRKRLQNMIETEAECNSKVKANSNQKKIKKSQVR